MTVREKFAAIKKSPVSTHLMPDLILAGKSATVNGYTGANVTTEGIGSNTVSGEPLFDSTLDGNRTTSETMSKLKDGINLRIYRVDEARIPNKTQGLFPVQEIIPVCFCPSFGLMKDSNEGSESIDDFRENLRLATVAIYSAKNFPAKYNGSGVEIYRHTQPEVRNYVPMDVANYIREFENKKRVDEGGNWYSCPFTLLFTVTVKDFI